MEMTRVKAQIAFLHRKLRVLGIFSSKGFLFILDFYVLSNEMGGNYCKNVFFLLQFF